MGGIREAWEHAAEGSPGAAEPFEAAKGFRLQSALCRVMPMTSAAGQQARWGQADGARDFCGTQRAGWGAPEQRGDPVCHPSGQLSSPEEEVVTVRPVPQAVMRPSAVLGLIGGRAGGNQAGRSCWKDLQALEPLMRPGMEEEK